MTSTIPEIPSELTLRFLSPGDADAGLRLSTLANWNQNRADWDFLLRNGWVKGVLNGDEIVASVAVSSYPPGIGWIGMVLVDPKWRGKGCAKRLMHEAVTYCEESGLVPGLDATPEGQQVYKRIAFIDVGELVRMRRVERRGDSVKSGSLEGETVTKDAGFKWDQEVFGHDRTHVLQWLEETYPDLCVGRLGSDGELDAVAWGRRGRTAVQIGPLLARSEESAQSLVIDFLESQETSWVIDVPVRHTRFVGWLHSQGFEVERGFTRMMRGRYGMDFRNDQFAVAGPELG